MKARVAMEPEEQCQSIGVTGTKRYESLFGRLIAVIDASEYTSERVATSAPDLKIFRLRDIFEEGSVFIGFGRPNVFIGMPRPNGGFEKFDAKSLKRADSAIVNTRGWAQSGLLLLLSLTDEQKLRIQQAAQNETGTRSWTCVNANCRVLAAAGFSSGGESLTSFYFPLALARRLIRHGLQCEGRDINIEIVKTTPRYLENFGLSVIKAQFLTICRHAGRKFRTKPTRLAAPEVEDIQAAVGTGNGGSLITLVAAEQSKIPTVIFSVSEPSILGSVLTAFLGPHFIFQVRCTSISVADDLPQKLTAYAETRRNIVTWLKQNILFSPTVVRAIRSNLMRRNFVVEDCPQSEIFEMIRTHTSANPIKYNIIITGYSIGVVRLSVRYPSVDWLLSKHVLTSGYSDDVRFAGEMWKLPDGRIVINNNSGTYMPSVESAINAAKYLNKVFDTVSFSAEAATV